MLQRSVRVLISSRKHSLLLRVAVVYLVLLLIVSSKYLLKGEVIYIVPSTLLMVLAALLIRYSKSRAYAGITLLSTVLLISILRIFTEFLSGFIQGFGASPYSRAAWPLVLNLYNLVAMALAVEFARAYIIINLKTRFSGSSLIIVVASMFLLVDIPFLRLARLFTTGNFMINLWQYIIPVAATNAFLTQLVSMGGPWYAVLYRVVTTSYKYFLPVIPIVPFYLGVLPGVVVPFTGLALLLSMVKPGSIKPGGLLTILAPSIAILLLLVVMMKIGLYPLVIASNSMEPSLGRGDLVIVRQGEISNVREGDVVAFGVGGGVIVVHRVMDIMSSASGITLVTKGDSNKDPDPWLVTADNYIGKVEASIPRIGYIAIYLKQGITYIARILTGNTQTAIVVAAGFVSALIFIILGYNKRITKPW